MSRHDYVHPIFRPLLVALDPVGGPLTPDSRIRDAGSGAPAGATASERDDSKIAAKCRTVGPTATSSQGNCFAEQFQKIVEEAIGIRLLNNLTPQYARERVVNDETPTYQQYDAMKLVRQAARLLAQPGDRVIYRDAFRWKDDATDSVLPNHYEMFSLKGLAAEFCFDVLHDFNHVAVIHP